MLQNLHTHTVHCDGIDTVENMCESAIRLGFDSLGYQSLAGLIEAIGLPEDCVCTYCWNGKG